MQWWEQMETEADLIRNGIYTTTGIKNAYRVAFAKGEGASRRDSTFDKRQGMHTCCRSKVAWRHKVACPHCLILEMTLPHLPNPRFTTPPMSPDALKP